MKRIQLLILLVPLAALLAVTGCTTPNTSARYVPPAGINPANTREVNGLKITVDPVFDAARSREYFNTDALADGVFPIHIQVENSNPGASFLVQKQNFGFNAGSGLATDTSASGTDIHSEAGDAVGTAGVVLLSAPLIVAGTISVGNGQAVQHNFVQAEFLDQTLSPGQSAGGFVYFQIKNGRGLSGGVFKAIIPDLRSQQSTRMEIPINR